MVPKKKNSKVYFYTKCPYCDKDVRSDRLEIHYRDCAKYQKAIGNG